MDEEQFKIKKRNIELENREHEAQDKNAARDAQRGMAWFALFGMLLYPFAVVMASLAKLDNAAEILGDMSGVYFASVAAIVAAFYGKEAFQKRE